MHEWIDMWINDGWMDGRTDRWVAISMNRLMNDWPLGW